MHKEIVSFSDKSSEYLKSEHFEFVEFFKQKSSDSAFIFSNFTIIMKKRMIFIIKKHKKNTKKTQKSTRDLPHELHKRLQKSFFTRLLIKILSRFT